MKIKLFLGSIVTLALLMSFLTSKSNAHNLNQKVLKMGQPDNDTVPYGSEYYPMKKGIKSVVTHYDKKGNVIKLVTNEITEYTVANEIENSTTTSVIEDKKKGGSPITMKFQSTFEKNVLTVDLKKITEETLRAGIKDPNVTITVDGNNFKLPNNLQIGQKLDEIDLDMNMTSGTTTFKFYMHYLDRTVAAKETVSTPAGTFECFVITSQSEVKMLTKKHGSSKSWIAKGVGLVKQIDYDKKGKVVSTEMLTEFKK